MKILAAVLLSLLFMTSTLSAKTRAQKLESKARSATGMLLLTNVNEIKTALSNGEAEPGAEVEDVCTIWNVQKTKTGYIALTAAHCIQLEGIADKSRLAGVEVKFGASYQESSENPIALPVRIIAVGNEDDWSNDVALIEVTTSDKRDVLEISDSASEPNLDVVLDVSSPEGGEVKSASAGYKAETLAIKGTDNSAWYSIPGTGPGSSGSAILSVKEGKVVEMLNVGNDLGVAGVRGARLSAFVEAHKRDSGSYVAPAKSDVNPKVVAEPWQRHVVSGQKHTDRGRAGSDHGRDTRGRDGHRVGRNDHRHLSRGDVRVREGHNEIFFGGFWFGCGVWPEWVFVDDVYFELVGDDWFVVEYTHPDIRFAVAVVE
jgi:hypothetical protein